MEWALEKRSERAALICQRAKLATLARRTEIKINQSFEVLLLRQHLFHRNQQFFEVIL
jgi:hypothetical protein